MKRILTLTALALVVGASAAVAQEATTAAAEASSVAGAPADVPAQPGHEGRGEKMFARLDANGDGSVSKEEFLKVQEEHFAKMDANGDGAFTQDEASAMREKMREMRQKHREKAGGESPAAPEASPAE